MTHWESGLSGLVYLVKNCKNFSRHPFLDGVSPVTLWKKKIMTNERRVHILHTITTPILVHVCTNNVNLIASPTKSSIL